MAGQSPAGTGVLGTTQSSSASAIFGSNSATAATPAGTVAGHGVFGLTTVPNANGVLGANNGGGTGVAGVSDNGTGVSAVSVNGTALSATSQQGRAIVGTSQTQDAINGTSASPQHAGVSATNTSPGAGEVPSGFAVWASAAATAIYAQGKPAGYFNGDVQITGDIILINSPSGADIAEDFDLEDDDANREPGTVLVIGRCGRLAACAAAYDTRVAGVVSGAGDLRPAIVLQRLHDRPRRSPVALLGKAVCKVDAHFGAIQAGDLLTTSPTMGHAMKASDRSKALGAVLGKALSALDQDRRGFVPILLSLR